MSRAAEVALPGASRSSAPDLRSLLNAGVLGRAALVALGLGTVLTLANQGEAVFGAGNLEILPLILVYLTPFIVVTVSQLLGVRQAKLDAPGGPTDEIFSSTALRHGIPARAVVNGGAKMPHARRPGGPVAAAQKCATYGPLSVLARGGGCTAWSSMRRFGWRLSMRG